MRENRKAQWIIGGILSLVVVGGGVASMVYWFHRRAWVSLDDPNPAVRAAAVRATGYEGHIDLLVKALQDKNEDVRLVAAMQVQLRKAEAAPATTALIALLNDKHAGVRREAIKALSCIGAPAVPALVEALADSDPRVRAGAALALSDVGRWKDKRERSAEERTLVVPALKKLLKDDDAEVRQNAAEALKDVLW